MVGATCNASAVVEFELLFHEIGSVTNLLNFLTTNHGSDEPHRMSYPACTEHHSPSHIQPECGETV